MTANISVSGAAQAYLDCLWGELYGSINANFWGGRISQELADCLRSKYLFEEEERPHQEFRQEQ